MVDGFYRIVFTGAHGSGFGLLVLREGFVAGADVGGALYDGLYRLSEGGDHLVIDVTMRAPAGIVPVQTGVSLAIPTDIPIHMTIPTNLAGGAPILIDTPLGRVNVIFAKIRDFA
jgi:hypothetical protein